jgi:hypothetical protein
MRHE